MTPTTPPIIRGGGGNLARKCFPYDKLEAYKFKYLAKINNNCFLHI